MRAFFVFSALPRTCQIARQQEKQSVRNNHLVEDCSSSTWTGQTSVYDFTRTKHNKKERLKGQATKNTCEAWRPLVLCSLQKHNKTHRRQYIYIYQRPPQCTHISGSGKMLLQESYLAANKRASRVASPASCSP